MVPEKFEIVAPSLSILAEPPVAVVDKVVDKRKTREVATAYLQYLYSAQGQEIAGKHFYRPRDAAIAQKYANLFAEVNLFTIDEVFGGWDKAQKAALRRRRDVRPDLQQMRDCRGACGQASGTAA